MSKEVRDIQVTCWLLVSRSDRCLKAELYPFGLQDPIPPFQLPLRHGDTEPLVDLQALLHRVYNRAGFDLAIEYTRDSVPPLLEADAIWVNALGSIGIPGRWNGGRNPCC